MSGFKWYRKLIGGYWAYTNFIGWQRLDKEQYEKILRERLGVPEWALENYE